ncbi:hypothetical protein HaLaN_03193 [Haematococcus lacustris]|uniref:Uncharacterized protein n=1 Tax=Haematococcus lacustris TaxID=44745 RepID=A0A699YQ10_HAELA|nr:hypothetical protein HaLaN_03193 [Haematococcus lacustris]
MELEHCTCRLRMDVSRLRGTGRVAALSRLSSVSQEVKERRLANARKWQPRSQVKRVYTCKWKERLHHNACAMSETLCLLTAACAYVVLLLWGLTSSSMHTAVSACSSPTQAARQQLNSSWVDSPLALAMYGSHTWPGSQKSM